MKPQEGNLPWQIRDVKVAVVGDLILDEYLEGSVDRISPEAPVPVVEGDHERLQDVAADVAREKEEKEYHLIVDYLEVNLRARRRLMRISAYILHFVHTFKY